MDDLFNSNKYNYICIGVIYKYIYTMSTRTYCYLSYLLDYLITIFVFQILHFSFSTRTIVQICHAS